MEFHDVGKHCDWSECKQLDFLPYRCDGCHKTFCQDHRLPRDHSCVNPPIQQVYSPSCPLCGTVVAVKKGEDPNWKVEQHIRAGCPSKPRHPHKCHVRGCTGYELVAVKCNKCHRNVCLKHRTPESHKCTGKKQSGNANSSNCCIS